MRGPRNSLSTVQSARLVNLIETEFVSSGKSDEDFGKYASEKLGFEVNPRNVHTRRGELGIPSHREAAKAAGSILIEPERIEALERQLAADRREFAGLAALVIDLQQRLTILQKAAKLKGTFEAPHG